MPNEVLLFGPSSSIRRLNMAIVQKSSTSKLTRILPSQRYNRYSLIDSAECSGNEWRFSSVRQLKTMSKQRFAPLTNTRNIRLFISKKVHRSAFVRAIHSFIRIRSAACTRQNRFLDARTPVLLATRVPGRKQETGLVFLKKKFLSSTFAKILEGRVSLVC